MKRRPIMLVLAGTVAAVVAVPLAASAVEAEGCSGSVTTTDAAGAELGSVEVPGPGATQADPLPVDPAGTVVWSGSTDAVITNGSWSITVGGVRVASGDLENADGETSAGGTENLADAFAPIAWALRGSMVIPVSGTLTGDGGSCHGSGWITGTGAVTSSPIFWSGLGLGVIGLLMFIGMFAGTKVVAGGAAAAGGAS
ncbi:hypothetical protein OEB99_15565 [Actinotalea sp. M2MS4P-6]|uniref:hypothetical protein n=1 Tax=Actinotalea sp. M2MS4P-6 TaxID=2983762 RepID=UPI0021E4C84F|nr:hypothetical protein [Actinotalea sp. M2MS4P-6]MCV2395733.1 hypothetical protein [Actinotalea sp. M2MS4P-6]